MKITIIHDEDGTYCKVGEYLDNKGAEHKRSVSLYLCDNQTKERVKEYLLDIIAHYYKV